MVDAVGHFVVPDSVDLLVFFSSDAVERSIEDGFWAYESIDARGMRLRFSFNVFERSVQTELYLNKNCVSTVSHEGATRMTLDKNQLRCEFCLEGCRATMALELGDAIRVDWSTLRVK